MRLFGLKFKYHATGVTTPAPKCEIVLPLLSPEDAALLNHDAMYLRALARERRAIDRHYVLAEPPVG
jgi:hypothetical protein